jgi:hypothetical protein
MMARISPNEFVPDSPVFELKAVISEDAASTSRISSRESQTTMFLSYNDHRTAVEDILLIPENFRQAERVVSKESFLRRDPKRICPEAEEAVAEANREKPRPPAMVHL